jgi:hypothetical protein
LSEQQVLAWADAWFAAQGKWPTPTSGSIPGTTETWGKVAGALRNGSRGFPGGSSLSQLLVRRRGKRDRACLPPLNEQQILAWATAHLQATGRWPMADSGPIAEAPGEKWSFVNDALTKGNRGLPGGSSLIRLLRRHGLDPSPRKSSGDPIGPIEPLLEEIREIVRHWGL